MIEAFAPYEDAKKSIQYMFGADAAEYAAIMADMFQATELYVYALNAIYEHSDMTEEVFHEELDAYFALNAGVSERIAKAIGVPAEQANEVFDLMANAHQLVVAKCEQTGKEMH
jgi:hypothetical protein